MPTEQSRSILGPHWHNSGSKISWSWVFLASQIWIYDYVDNI